MSSQEEIIKRFDLNYDFEFGRRIIAGKEVIIHCHHYNARIQHTIEGAQNIDGKAIIRDAAENVFGEQIQNAFLPEDTSETKWEVARLLYGHLGYGQLDFSQISDGIVTADASHMVEGRKVGFKEDTQPVCTLTEGYIQGAIQAIEGKRMSVRETECINSGAERCRFEVQGEAQNTLKPMTKSEIAHKPQQLDDDTLDSNIDEKAIIEALVGMPIHGDDSGLIPAFNVYLANTPADFYNQVCINFIEEMSKQNLLSTAKKLLLFAGETCAMNTFRGILDSAEWEGLIAPMVQNEEDKLIGLVAVSNALGWGGWHVTELEPGELMTIVSSNGYEAYGYQEYVGEADKPQCYMLTGVATGLMELIYSEGTVEEKFGTFAGEEEHCIAASDQFCQFVVEII